MVDRSYLDQVEFLVMGPLRVLTPDGPVEIRGAKERLLLAHLISRAGQVVTTAELIDGLWGDDPPRTAAKSLQTYVLRVRNALEPDRGGAASVIVTEGHGYRLQVEPAQVDAHRFSRLLAVSREGRPHDRLATLGEALDLWRGTAYAGMSDSPTLAGESTRLDELRLGALEDKYDLELQAGDGRTAVAELERLVNDHPVRERLWALLMRGLYQQGRQAEALAAYERARRWLSDEIGVDPGAELQDLHARVLAQDATLAPATTTDELPAQLRSPAFAVQGRASELQAAVDIWRAARAGGPRRVALRGPRGAGARTVAALLAEEVGKDRGAVAYLGPGDEPAEPSGGWDLLVVDRARVGQRLPAARLTCLLVDPGHAVPGDATVIDLGPLDRGAVRSVVAGYVGGDEVESATDRILAESGGWPAQIHAAAVSYVRSTAAAAVSVAVGEADRSRATLRDAQSRIATGIMDLHQISAAADESADRSPWPGLSAYEIDDGPWFAGRERLVAEMLARIAGTTCLAVVGASGSGKSSAVRAGLLAGLADGQLPGSAGWERVVLRPGPHPMRELTQQFLGRRRRDLGAVLERLVRVPEDAVDRTVVVIDQFEEVWTACADESERSTFLDTIGTLAADEESGITLVLVLRADYLANLADWRQLAALVEDNTVLVGAPSLDDVRRAVALPAARAGLVFDEGLVDALVGDAGDEPGLLPLLSTALSQLWEARDGRRLRFEAYVRLGGIDGAIRHLAETAYAGLDPAARETMRTVLMRLAGPGEADLATRRRVALSELTQLPAPDVRQVLDRMVEARLVTVEGDDVEVAHEALFREWPRLRDWLREDAAGRALQRRIAAAAADWDAEGRDPGLLWSGTRLAAAVELADAGVETLTGVEREFVAAGQAEIDAARVAAEQEARAKVRQNRRLRFLLIGVIVLLALSLAAGAIAFGARNRADESARSARSAAVAADAKRLAASALSIEYPDLALLAAVEATSLEQGPETYGALLTLLSRQPDVITRYRIADRFLRNAATPDGSVVVLSDNVGVLRGLDGATGELLWTRDDLDAGIGSLAMSPDGSVLAATVYSAEAAVLGFDPEDGSTLWSLPMKQAVRRAGPGASSYLWSNLGWTADRHLVFASDSHVFVADLDGEVQHAVPWGRPVRDTSTMYVWADGRVSTGNDDYASGFVVGPVTRGSRGGVGQVDGYVAAVSPDGRRAVVVRETATTSAIELADTHRFRPRSGAVTVDGFLLDADFSPDGRRLAIATDDEDVLMLDGVTGERVGTLSGHSGSVLNAAWAGADHAVLWTAGRDGTAVAFDASGREGVIRTEPSPDVPAAGESAGDVSIWSDFSEVDVNRAFLRGSDGKSAALPLTGLASCPCQVTSTELTPDGSVALGGYASWEPGMPPRTDIGQVVAWDTATREVVAVATAPSPITAIAVTPDGERAVVVTAVGWTMLDLESFELSDDWQALDPVDAFGVSEATARAEVAPDGSKVALLRGNRVIVADLDVGGEPVSRAIDDADDLMLSAAWTPDSSSLLVGSQSGRVHFLDAGTLEESAPTRLITGGYVIDVEISDDGAVAATLGTDGDVLLWDARTWKPYGLPVLDHGQWGYLSFEGDRLRVDHQEGTRSYVAIAPEQWVDAACQAANRDLTEEEFAVLFPGADYHRTCGDRD